MLRNLTPLSPISPNAMRWSGLCRMLKRFLEIRDELLIVADQDAATIMIERRTTFVHKTKKYSAMLAEIDFVTLEMQKRGTKSSDCDKQLTH